LPRAGIQFIHTEASDPQVAQMLTRMMGPLVLVMPSLNEIPDRLLATVFVFRNNMPTLTWPDGRR